MSKTEPAKFAGKFAPASRAVFWLILACLGGIPFFWLGFSALIQAWYRPEYSYGPMVPLITGYMTLREIKHRPVRFSEGSKLPGFAVFVLGLLISLLGNLSEIPDFVTYGFIVVIGGLILIIAGTREGFRFWPGWLHLFFMLPLPNIVYWHASTALQLISSKLGVAFISMAGVPVFLDGNVIDLGTYQLLVAEACSGLRYLFPLLSFGWLFAVLYTGPNWHRVVLFLSTVPITVFMNSFRIGMIGLLVNYFGISQAEGFLHVFEGWIIFLACTITLYCEAWILNRFVSTGPRSRNLLDVDFHGIAGPLKRFAILPANRSLAAAAMVMLTAGFLWYVKPSANQTMVERVEFRNFPMEIADWQGQPEFLDESVERVLRADDYLLTVYKSGASNVSLFMTFYEQQNGGSGIHSPEVCLPSGGWEVSQWKQVDVPVGSESGIIVPVNRAVIQKGLNRQLVYYWFEQRGRRMTSDYTAKLVSIWDTVVMGRSDGGLVRLVTPIGSNEDPAVADKRLRQFLGDVIALLPDYFPPRDRVKKK